jgi:hypothetical protein
MGALAIESMAAIRAAWSPPGERVYHFSLRICRCLLVWKLDVSNIVSNLGASAGLKERACQPWNCAAQVSGPHSVVIAAYYKKLSEGQHLRPWLAPADQPRRGHSGKQQLDDCSAPLAICSTTQRTFG